MTNRNRRRGFTLIELLVVIAIMAALAAMIFPATRSAHASRLRHHAKSELKEVETYIELYKSKLGFYPASSSSSPPTVTPLFYELAGTRLTAGTYTTLNGSSQLKASDVMIGFGLPGFANTIEGAGNQDAQQPQDFFHVGLKPDHFLLVTISNNAFSATANVVLMGSTIEGANMLPGTSGGMINPFGYNSLNPTNNSKSYDLWLDIIVNGVTNRMCNWREKPIVL